MSTRVVSDFTGVVIVMNSLKTYMSASLEARANATVFTKATLVTEGGGTRVSGTGVANSSGTKDSVSFKGQNVMLPNTQPINRL